MRKTKVDEKQTELDLREDAGFRVSYGMLFLISPAIFGLLVWLTQLHFTVQASASEISGVEERVKKMDEAIARIDKTVAEVKALLLYQLEKEH